MVISGTKYSSFAFATSITSPLANAVKTLPFLRWISVLQVGDDCWFEIRRKWEILSINCWLEAFWQFPGSPIVTAGVNPVSSTIAEITILSKPRRLL
jgi:hypothetical protein